MPSRNQEKLRGESPGDSFVFVAPECGAAETLE